MNRIMIWKPVIGIVGLILVAGCGDDTGLAKRYSVSGTITYNGKNVESGTVSFVPVDGSGRAAGGTITDGQYSLTTQTPGDGALPGKYKVGILSKLADPSSVQIKMKKPGGGQFSEAEKKMLSLQHQQIVAGKAAKTAKPLIPEKYDSPDTSGLTYEVKEQSNTANFELKD